MRPRRVIFELSSFLQDVLHGRREQNNVLFTRILQPEYTRSPAIEGRGRLVGTGPYLLFVNFGTPSHYLAL